MMASAEIARWILDQCVKGAPWSAEDVDQIIDDPALFRILAEGLSDRFEPHLVDRYVEIFTHVLGKKLKDASTAALRERYARVREPREFGGNSDAVRDIYVLSRVTLGADVAITSVILDAVKRRFRTARIWLCGDRKSYQLFEADNRIGYYPLPYQRGVGLDQILAERPAFKSGLVIDPDSRVTQLGLVPVCAEENYLFFESRRAGGDSEETLSQLTAHWARSTFGVEAKPYIAPKPVRWGAKYVSVSLGNGGNQEKGLAGGFERQLLERLAQGDLPVVVDLGGGGEESERVRVAVQGLKSVSTHKGSFSDFASIISQSAHYYGYDSAGSHVAATSGVPMTVFFKGHVNERMFQRWKPSGGGAIRVIRIDEPAPAVAAILAVL